MNSTAVGGANSKNKGKNSNKHKQCYESYFEK